METISTRGVEDARDRVVAQTAAAVAKLVETNPVPVGCTVEFIPTLPYTGTEAPVTAIVRQPMNEDFASLPA